MNLDVSPQIEEQIMTLARLNNLAPSDLVTKVLTGDLPPLRAARAKAAVEQATPISEASRDQKQAAAVALLESFLEESPTDPEVQRQAEADFEDFKRNLNANRLLTGERPLFP